MHSVSDDHAKGEQQWNGLRFTLDSLFLAARAAKSVCTCLSSVPSSVCAIEPGAKCAEGLFHPPLDSQQRGVCMETSWTVLLQPQQALLHVSGTAHHCEPSPGV